MCSVLSAVGDSKIFVYNSDAKRAVDLTAGNRPAALDATDCGKRVRVLARVCVRACACVLACVCVRMCVLFHRQLTAVRVRLCAWERAYVRGVCACLYM